MEFIIDFYAYLCYNIKIQEKSVSRFSIFFERKKAKARGWNVRPVSSDGRRSRTFHRLLRGKKKRADIREKKPNAGIRRAELYPWTR